MNRQRGVTYLMMLVAIALIGVGLAIAGQAYSEQQRRGHEQELVRVGAAFIHAIETYYESSPGTEKVLPQKLDDLLMDNRFAGTRRHLRRVYVDPITGSADWGLVRTPSGAIAGVYSLSEKPTVAKTTLTIAGQRVEFGDRYSDAKFVFVPVVVPAKR